MSYLSFTPIYQPRVWGGRRLAQYLKRPLPANVPIGESWEIVDRPEAQSIITHGSWKGTSLRQALELYAEDILGPHWPTNKPFPILVKWLDCQERLSLQVHPPKNLAQELQGEPKSENWYIMHAEANAQVIAGVKPGVERKAFEEAIANHTLEGYVNHIPVTTGDSVFVPSGRLHAIDAGSVILEIQENSDTTYRIYDWGRVGLDGRPRELHVEKSMRSINFQDIAPQVITEKPGEQLLVDCSVFRIRKVNLNPGDQPLQFSVGEGATILSIVGGQLRLIGDPNQDPNHLCMGNNLLLPYSCHFSFEALKPSTILITDHFALS